MKITDLTDYWFHQIINIFAKTEDYIFNIYFNDLINYLLFESSASNCS